MSRVGEQRMDRPGLGYRVVVTALISVFLVTYLAVGFTRGSLYPFSGFPMYSGVYAAPYETSHFELIGLTADGHDVRHLEAPLGMAILNTWLARAGDEPELLDRIGATVLQHNGRLLDDIELVAVRLVRHTTVVPEHPEITPEHLGTEVVHEFRPRGSSNDAQEAGP